MSTIPTISAIAWFLLAVTAQAACFVPGLPSVTTDYCDGCRYETVIVLDHNEICERAAAQPGRTSEVEYLGIRIVQKAKHGIAGANGVTIAYQPSKDYVGTDDFVTEMTYRENGKTSKFTVHYSVTIK